jgi:hypothetical protein
MGTETDLENRVSQARVDSNAQCANIAKARKQVYEKGASAKGSTIENILGGQNQWFQLW